MFLKFFVIALISFAALSSGRYLQTTKLHPTMGPTTFSVMTFSTLDLIMAVSIKDTQHKHCAERQYADCCVLCIVMLNVIMPSVILLNVVMPNVVAFYHDIVEFSKLFFGLKQ
jgi:hypothetical protein